MTLWIAAWTLFLLALSHFLWGLGHILLPLLDHGAQSRLKRARETLLALRECLEAGASPPGELWQRVRDLEAPWGNLINESLQGLRDQGQPLIPTLKRYQELFQFLEEVFGEAQARSAQPLYQAILCGILAPMVGLVLWWVVPTLAERPWLWGSLVAGATLLCGVGTLWLLVLVDQARWFGLKRNERPHLILMQGFGERFLSQVHGGRPADLAWVDAVGWLQSQAPGLLPGGLWEEGETSRQEGVLGLFANLINSMRRGIQVSLMEGRPCTPRVEAGLAEFRIQLRAEVGRRVALLGTQALKPLFVCVAPALMGLVGSALLLEVWVQGLGRW